MRELHDLGMHAELQGNQSSQGCWGKPTASTACLGLGARWASGCFSREQMWLTWEICVHIPVNEGMMMLMRTSLPLQPRCLCPLR